MTTLPATSTVDDLVEPPASTAQVDLVAVPATEGTSAPEQHDARSVPTVERRWNKKLGIACVIMVALCGTWAFWPLAQPPTANQELPTAPMMVASADRPRPLDLAAFQAPLWVAPIPPPAPPPPPPPPPPLKLQLIAITTGEDGSHNARAALIFDPDQNKLFTLTVGQTIGGRTVTKITESGVDVHDSAGTRQLSLKSDRSPQREPVPAAAKDPGEATP